MVYPEETGRLRKKRKLRFARQLRVRMTPAETAVWAHLRRQQCAGLKFRRQVPILGYIVDFLCVEKNLIVELDGAGHRLQREYDEVRDTQLRKRGYTILRFPNKQVYADIHGVLATIRKAALE